MKKKIIIILLAIVIGGMLAFFTLTKTKITKDMELISLNVLQTGVFANYENALEQKKRFDNAVIYQENGYYLVIVGASTNELGLAKIEKLLTDKQVAFYKKKINILEKDKDLFMKYNMLLEKAENEETVLLLNQKILEKMIEV